MVANILLNLAIQIIYSTYCRVRYYNLGPILCAWPSNWLRESREEPRNWFMDYMTSLMLTALLGCIYHHYNIVVWGEDLILLYHMYLNNLRINFTDYFTTLHVTFTRGHSCKLFKPHAISWVRSNFFSVRIIDFWNSLLNHHPSSFCYCF